MMKVIVLLAVFALLLGQENKIVLILDVQEPNVQYSYLNKYFFYENTPKDMSSNYVSYEDTGLKTIELKWEKKISSLRDMFSDCADIVSIDLSNFDTSNVEDMSGMFYGCISLESLDVSKFNTSKVEDMSYMF